MPLKPKRRRRLERSSTDAALRGWTLDGRTIAKIEKLGGGRRRVSYVSGKPSVEHRSTLHEMMKARGWIEYRKRLEQARTPAERKAIIAASLKRQRGILGRHLEDLAQGAIDAPRHVRLRIGKRISALKRAKFGSPILGQTPATSAVPPHFGPAKTFTTLRRASVRYRTITLRGQRRVIPLVA